MKIKTPRGEFNVVDDFKVVYKDSGKAVVTAMGEFGYYFTHRDYEIYSNGKKCVAVKIK